MKETEFRPLSENERRILEKLFEQDFMGRDELSRQMNGLLVKQIDKNGSLTFRTQPSDSANVGGGSPIVEASYSDGDDNQICPISVHVLLHVKEGKLSMLEIYKDDSSPLSNPIDPNKFDLFSPVMKPAPGNTNNAAT